MDTRILIAAALVSAAAGTMAAAPAAQAALIDFEGGSDDQAIGPDTFADTNVRFVAAGEHELFFEARGNNDPDGFLYDQGGVNDVEAPGAGASLGNYFMRTGEHVSDRTIEAGTVFSMEYERGVTTPISGEIWDIDGNAVQGTERWTVAAYDEDGALLAALLSPLGVSNGAGSLDGRPWTFLFDGSDTGSGGYSLAEVRRLDFAFVGDKTIGNGFGFDNFQTGAPVPLPAAAWFLLTGLGGLAGLRWLGSGRKAA